MKKYLDPLKGYQLAIQITSILLCSIMGSLFSGIWLDRKLGTKPCLMLLLMILGIGLGVYTVYQAVKEYQNK